jgi:hypothetical protein
MRSRTSDFRRSSLCNVRRGVLSRCKSRLRCVRCRVIHTCVVAQTALHNFIKPSLSDHHVQNHPPKINDIFSILFQNSIAKRPGSCNRLSDPSDLKDNASSSRHVPRLRKYWDSSPHFQVPPQRRLDTVATRGCLPERLWLSVLERFHLAAADPGTAASLPFHCCLY